MTPRPKKLGWLDRVRIFQQRYLDVPSYVVAVVAITLVALIATGIGWLLYRS